MRVVFVGASDLSVETAALLIERSHEVVIIEADRDKINDLSETLDCSFLHGDGSTPSVLEEAGPGQADYLFCLTENDQYNIIAALVGRSLGYSDVVLQIHNEDYLNICRELDLQNTITPSQTIARYLADMVAGVDILELSSLVKGDARFLMVEIDKESSGSVEELDLPEKARVICLYRNDKFRHVDQDTRLKDGDEALILTHQEHLKELSERFNAETADDSDDGED